MLKKTREVKVHKTLTMTISFWALVEQIRSKQGLDTADEAIAVSVLQLARKIGIESWWVNLTAINGTAGLVQFAKPNWNLMSSVVHAAKS